MTLEQARAEAAQRFKAAKAELRACGLPLDVIDAALRPLWNATQLTLSHPATPGP